MCGIIGLFEKSSIKSHHSVSLNDHCAKKLVKGLRLLQHRGQDAAGLLSSRIKNGRFLVKKGPGFVSEVFSDLSDEEFCELDGEFLLGHTRYETVGGPSESNIPPFQVPHSNNAFKGSLYRTSLYKENLKVPSMGIVHNGNIVNYYSLKEEMENSLGVEGEGLEGENDGELILRLFQSFFIKESNSSKHSSILPPFWIIQECIKQLSEKIEGGYALLLFIEGVGLVAYRDPHGIRPLVYGKGDNGKVCFSSETVALEGMGFKYEREVRPGEVIFVGLSGSLQSAKLASNNYPKKGPFKEAPCMFERIYFASSKSKVQGSIVKNTRRRLGTVLAEKVLKKNRSIGCYDAVSAIPETGSDAAFGVASSLNLPMIEGILKAQKSGRTFILPGNKRGLALKQKFIVRESEIKNKRLLLVDDSLVRGATLKSLIFELKEKGAKELSLAFSCPPIKFGCFYGVDFPGKMELLANQKTHDEMAAYFGVKDLFFLNEDDLLNVFDGQDHCFGCVTERYPTKLKEGITFAHKRTKEKLLVCTNLDSIN